MEQFKFELIPVPTEALEAVGIVPGVTAEAFVDGDRLIIQKASADAFCDNFNEDCEGCPFCCPECGECLKGQIDDFYGEDGGDE